MTPCLVQKIEISPYLVNHIKSLHPYRCDSVVSSYIDSIPSVEEIQETIFSLPHNKAAGPDGFSLEFYTLTWDLVDNDLALAVREFFTSSFMSRHVNATIISLILKETGSEILSEFRPVFYCNTIYKVISQILDVGLTCFLSEAVQSNQVGLVKGRLICKNVMMAS